MCRMPDSRPMRLVKKWLRGGTSTKAAARSRPPTTVGDARTRDRPSSICSWRLSTDERTPAAQKPRRSCSSSPSRHLLCPAAFCWGRQRSKRDLDDDSQQSLALVSRCHPFRVVQPFNDDEVDITISIHIHIISGERTAKSQMLSAPCYASMQSDHPAIITPPSLYVSKN